MILEINNSITKIKEIDSYINKNIDDLLSYKKQDAYFLKNTLIKKWHMSRDICSKIGFDSFKSQYPSLVWLSKISWEALQIFIEKNSNIRLFNKKNNSFPTGLLDLVTDYFSDQNLEFEKRDLREPPKTRKVYRKLKQQPPLRYYQQEIIQKCLENPRGIIEAATGTGKTNCIIELIYQLKNNALIIVPSSTILSQFYDILIKVFGKKHIGIITGNKKQLDKPISIATYQSLPNIDKTWFSKIDTLIVDEAHHGACDTLVDLNSEAFNDIYYRYYFSGTAYRNDGTDMSLQSVISNKFLYKYSALKGIEEKYLVPVYFLIYDFYHEAQRYTWQKELSDLIVKNEKYNDMIVEKAKILDGKGVGTIIFVDQIQHGQYLEKRIPNSKFANGTEKRAINSKTIEDFNKGKFNILIGTSVLGEGVDTVRASVGIMAGGGKAKSSVMQRIGRLLRPFPGKKEAVVFDFTHQNSKYLRQHYIERSKIYEEFGKEKIKIIKE